MKALICLVCLFMASFSQAATTINLPPVEVSEKTLGGAVLLIRMKHSLVIEGSENQQILAELGDSKKRDFFKDLVMEAKPKDLRDKYESKSHPAVSATIAKYEALTVDQTALQLK